MKVIRIGAMWCPGCIIMQKKWNKLKESHPELEFEDYDFDMDEDEVAGFNIGDTLPVAIIVEEGNEVRRLIGEKSENELLAFIGAADEE